MRLPQELYSSRELLLNLTARDVKGKYKRTALGQMWSLITPLAQMAIYTFVFSFVFRVTPEPGVPSGLDIFPLWLLCGLLPWAYFVNVINGGMGAVVDNAGLVKKVFFPRSVLVAAVPLASGFSFVVELAVLSVVLVVAGGMPLPWLPLVMVAVVLLGLFGLGIGMALATANVYFRDTQHLVSLLTQVWFYATPIIYPASYVLGQLEASDAPTWIWTAYQLNPMLPFVDIFRALLYDNRLPDLVDLGIAVGWTALAVTVGSLTFRRHERDFAEEL